MPARNVKLIKSLLVACDQSYFLNPLGLQGAALAPLPDRTSQLLEYQNQEIYKDYPDFTWDSGSLLSG